MELVAVRGGGHELIARGAEIDALYRASLEVLGANDGATKEAFQAIGQPELRSPLWDSHDCFVAGEVAERLGLAVLARELRAVGIYERAEVLRDQAAQLEDEAFRLEATA